MMIMQPGDYSLLPRHFAHNFSLSKCENYEPFLADRTNGRAYATVLRLSVCGLSVVCDVMYCG